MNEHFDVNGLGNILQYLIVYRMETLNRFRCSVIVDRRPDAGIQTINS